MPGTFDDIIKRVMQDLKQSPDGSYDLRQMRIDDEAVPGDKDTQFTLERQRLYDANKAWDEELEQERQEEPELQPRQEMDVGKHIMLMDYPTTTARVPPDSMLDHVPVYKPPYTGAEQSPDIDPVLSTINMPRREMERNATGEGAYTDAAAIQDAIERRRRLGRSE